MGEPFDHCPPGWIRQSRKRCTQSIHNHMVVDALAMSSVNFAIPDFCSRIPNVPSVGRQEQLLDRVSVVTQIVPPTAKCVYN
jgi:hypothetical protein